MTEYAPTSRASLQIIGGYGIGCEVSTQGLKGSTWIDRQPHRSVMTSRRYPGNPMTRVVFSITAEREGLSRSFRWKQEACGSILRLSSRFLARYRHWLQSSRRY